MPAPTESRELRLGERDEELLAGLTRRYRLITAGLTARLWGCSEVLARRRLGRLRAADLLRAYRVQAYPLLNLSGPLVVWTPGDPAPPFGPTGYRLKARWDRAPQATTVYLASLRAARLFGGTGGRFTYPLQATHDLHVTAIYVGMAEANDPRLARWRGEEALRLARRRGKVPDAVLVDDRGRAIMAIEFGGSYRPDRVRSFHRVCENRRLPYELW